MSENFDIVWARITDLPPVAHQLKFDLADRWVRIHSLPGAKRYADTADEREQILMRASAVLTYLSGESPEVVLVTGLWGPATAEFKLAEVLVMLPTARTAVHPYDGGIDIISPTRQHRDDVASRFSDWLSPLESGL